MSSPSFPEQVGDAVSQEFMQVVRARRNLLYQIQKGSVSETEAALGTGAADVVGSRVVGCRADADKYGDGNYNIENEDEEEEDVSSRELLAVLKAQRLRIGDAQEQQENHVSVTATTTTSPATVPSSASGVVIPTSLESSAQGSTLQLLRTLKPGAIMRRAASFTPAMMQALHRIQEVFDSKHPDRDEQGPFQINANLYLGDIFQAKDRAKLTQLQITHVVNFANYTNTGRMYYMADHVCPYVKDYYSVAAVDSSNYPFLDDHILDVYQYYIKNLENDSKAKFFFHCMAGVNRSVTAVVACLMLQENVNVVEAINRVRNARGFILSNASFVKQLVALAEIMGLLGT